MTQHNHPPATRREKVLLPPMPSDEDGLAQLPKIEMPKGEIIGDTLVFPNNASDYKKALQLGFFLLKIPKATDLHAGDSFVKNFFKPKDGDKNLDSFRGYKSVDLSEPYQGYFDRPFDQWENYYIESAHWSHYLTPSLARLGNQMTHLGVTVLKNILTFLAIPQPMWTQLTSGLSDKQGHHMFGFNHFRSDKPIRGTKFHRDSGWVTVLRSWQPGLVALIDEVIYAIDPVDGYFIINFGSSIEVLTGALGTPARANIHGVVKTTRKAGEDNRYSYVMFLDSHLTGNIYQLDQHMNAHFLQTLTEFAEQEVSRTYDDDNVQL